MFRQSLNSDLELLENVLFTLSGNSHQQPFLSGKSPWNEGFFLIDFARAPFQFGLGLIGPIGAVPDAVVKVSIEFSDT